MAASPVFKAALEDPSRRGLRKKRRFHCAVGVLSAGLLFELGLRPFVADAYLPGSFPVRTIQNYYEGLAVAHFEPDGLGQLGNRLTGNQPLSGAHEGLIVGDSHVVAYSVRDPDTIGAVIERLSRASGQPLNIRQYGWPGANAGTFLAAANSLLQARNPAWVAVLLNPYNIGVNALTSHDWRMEVASDYSVRLLHGPYPHQTALRKTLLRWTGRSALALALWRRMGLIWNVVGILAARSALPPSSGRKVYPPVWAASLYANARAFFKVRSNRISGIYVLVKPSFWGAFLIASWVLAVLLFGATGANPFVYFQF
jgi:hypothetical protein